MYIDIEITESGELVVHSDIDDRKDILMLLDQVRLALREDVGEDKSVKEVKGGMFINKYDA